MRRILAAILLTAALLSGCTTTALPGSPRAQVVDPGTVAGRDVTSGTSGPRPGSRDANLPVTNSDRGIIDKLATNTIADVQTYWSRKAPEVFGRPLPPVRALVSYDSTGPNQLVCNSSTQGFSNAFYCPSQDLIAWDRGELLPRLVEAHGQMAVPVVLAHEYGHAVQNKLDLVKPGSLPLVLEQQADCFAGAFIREVVDGRTEHFVLNTGDGLNGVLTAMFSLKDPVRGDPRSPRAHGNAFDRVSAFQFGFNDGPRRCAQIDNTELNSRVTEIADFTDGTDLPITIDSLNTTLAALNLAFPLGGKPPRVTVTAAECPDAKPTSPAAYCPATNTITLNMPALQRIGAAPQRGRPDSFGDFAAFAELASRYALAVQQQAKLPLDDETTSLRTACIVGAWSAATSKKPPGDRPHIGDIILSPGDLDEAVAEMLSNRSLIASDVNGKPAKAGFARVQAFRIGFLDGFAHCQHGFNS
ncbi:aminopeptidase [Pseudonocardiaceae bacterium YIM PH 21723]|nr:aminopeptidase [Pseudonocardiaceae bacterium YIM PH 21723]